jgi:hypothetical protein
LGPFNFPLPLYVTGSGLKYADCLLGKRPIFLYRAYQNQRLTMIYTKDIRLGNLITWNPKLLNPQVTLSPMQVEIAAITTDKIGYTPYKLEQRVEPFEDDLMIQMETIFKSPDEFEPIILTIEILEKTGFEISGGKYHLKGFYPELYLKENIWNAELVPGSSRIEIRYLHQLQNLFYTIVAEELEVVL